MVLLSLLACQRAQAKPTFAILLDTKNTRTYDVVEQASGKPIGEQATLSVRSIDKQGAYTLIDVKIAGGGTNQFSPLHLMIGPAGVREVIVIMPENHDERHFSDAYGSYVPRVYLPATLAPQRFPRALHVADDRAYVVAGEFTRRDPHTWRMTWKGSYTAAAGQFDGTNTKLAYDSVVDFDPDVGFTLICSAKPDDQELCLRLHR